MQILTAFTANDSQIRACTKNPRWLSNNNLFFLPRNRCKHQTSLLTLIRNLSVRTRPLRCSAPRSVTPAGDKPLACSRRAAHSIFCRVKQISCCPEATKFASSLRSGLSCSYPTLALVVSSACSTSRPLAPPAHGSLQ